MLEIDNFTIETDSKKNIILCCIDTGVKSQHNQLGGALWEMVSHKIKPQYLRNYVEKELSHRFPFDGNDIEHLCKTGEICERCIKNILALLPFG